MSKASTTERENETLPFLPIFPELGEAARTFGALLYCMKDEWTSYFAGLNKLAATSGLSIATTKRHIRFLAEIRWIVGEGRNTKTNSLRTRNKRTYRPIISRKEFRKLSGYFRFPLEMASRVDEVSGERTTPIKCWTQCIVYSLAVWRCDGQESGTLASAEHGRGAAYVSAKTGLSVDLARRALRQLVAAGLISYDADSATVTLGTISRDNLIPTSPKEAGQFDPTGVTNRSHGGDNLIPRGLQNDPAYREKHFETKHSEDSKESKQKETNHAVGFSFEGSQGEGAGVQSADLAGSQSPRTKKAKATLAKSKVKSARQIAKEERAAAAENLANAFCDAAKVLHKSSLDNPAVVEVFVGIWLVANSDNPEHAAARRRAPTMQQLSEEYFNPATQQSELAVDLASWILGRLRRAAPEVAELLIPRKGAIPPVPELRSLAMRLAPRVIEILHERAAAAEEEFRRMNPNLMTCEYCNQIAVNVVSDRQRDYCGKPVCGVTCHADERKFGNGVNLWLLLNGGDVSSVNFSPEDLETAERLRRGELQLPAKVVEAARKWLSGEFEDVPY